MTKEDKLQRLLEMQEHPERYTEKEIRQLMSDEECRQLYEQMVRATDAIFAGKAKTSPQTLPTVGRTRTLLYKIAAVFVGLLMLSGIAYAAIHIVRSVEGNQQSQTQETQITNPQQEGTNHPTEETTDSIPPTRIFENVPLDEMVNELATYYNKVADIRNVQAHELRLYYKWERKDKLESVVNDLNHFDHVNLTLEEDKLIVKP